jgi:hypothetical protein
MTFVGGSIALGPDVEEPAGEPVTLPLPVGAAVDDVAIVISGGEVDEADVITGGPSGTGWEPLTDAAFYADSSGAVIWGKVLDAGDIAAGDVDVPIPFAVATSLAVIRDYGLAGVVALTDAAYDVEGDPVPTFTYGALTAQPAPMLLVHHVLSSIDPADHPVTYDPPAALTVADTAYVDWVVSGGGAADAFLAARLQPAPGAEADVTWEGTPGPYLWTAIVAAFVPADNEVDVEGGGPVEATATGGVALGGAVDIDGGGDVVALAYATTWPAPTPEAADLDEPDADEVPLQQYAETYDHPDLVDGVPVDGWGPED